MPWNSTWPVGSISVKANRAVGQQNTTYIETTMGNSIVGTNTASTRDHFWNVGANQDGRHRFIQSPAFTVGSNPADPVLGTGMDGVFYFKADGLTPSRVGGWFRNAQNILQCIPILLTGSVSIPSSSSFVLLANVPDNSYGEIFMYSTDANANTEKYSTQTGFYKARGGTAQGYAVIYGPAGSSTGNALKFGNGSDASLLALQVRRSDASSSFTTWNYIITYRKLI